MTVIIMIMMKGRETGCTELEARTVTSSVWELGKGETLERKKPFGSIKEGKECHELLNIILRCLVQLLVPISSVQKEYVGSFLMSGKITY